MKSVMCRTAEEQNELPVFSAEVVPRSIHTIWVDPDILQSAQQLSRRSELLETIVPRGDQNQLVPVR